MENIHGVDVSWLHRSTNDPSVKASNKPVPQPTATPPLPVLNKPDVRTSVESKERSEPRAVPKPTSPPPPNAAAAAKASPKRSGILGRLSSEKASSVHSHDEQKGAKRSSWRSGWGSKFSSSPGAVQEVPATTSRAPKSSSLAVPKAQQHDLPKVISDDDEFEDDDETPTQPSKSGSSFFSSALRRLSSTGGPQGSAPAAEQYPACERRILNVDEGRDRPSLKELNQAKLRRVSFSVDVEIAGNSRYPVEESAVDDDPAVKKSKKKDKKIKERAEGESLKHPGLRKGETSREGLLHAMGRDGMFDIGMPDSDDDKPNAASPPSSPPEKEVKRRKENPETPPASPPPQPAEPAKSPDLPKPVDAPKATEGLPQDSKDVQPNELPDGDTAPRNSSVSDAQNDESQASKSKPPQKSNDRPTTDPLRIYRRCCQLREAPVLKRISEQLGNPRNCGADTPGVVTTLNLTKSRMQLTDIVCLGDWLAVVPVKKLLLEDANLTDEGVRIILSGLLAAKVPEIHKRKRGRSSPTRLRDNTIIRTPGVIEKLTLKNNRKLTGEAWRHICLFLHMSKSIKAVDVSMIPLPKSFAKTPSNVSNTEQNPAVLLSKSLSNRHAGEHLEELIFAECDLDAHQVGQITEAATRIRLKRLGLAGNSLDAQGLEHVARYIGSKVCKGVDLGGNDLRERLPIITAALGSDNPIWAICLDNCNLDVDCLQPLFLGLVSLPDIRFVDLSHNKHLFDQKPSALATLRVFLPQLPMLKRIHLSGVSMSPADLIGLAEVIPEVRNLAHLNVLENPKIAAVLSSTDSSSQEEACAMFASIMTAVRLSKTLFCVDIDVPGEESSEVVKALARQTFAYCLRNMEAFSDVIGLSDAAAALPDISAAEVGFLKDIANESGRSSDELQEPARPDDIIVGGRGWIKALSHCLDAADFRRVSVGGNITPAQVMDSAAGRAKAKEVSKTLLVNARTFRVQLEGAIAREQRGSPSEEVMRRLQFLQHALNSMIERFEQEYPDTRLPPAISSTGEPRPPSEIEAVDLSDSPAASRTSSPSRPSEPSEPSSTSENVGSTLDDFFDNDIPVTARRLSHSSRRGSEVELHNRQLTQEEGELHKMGQRFRRDVLPPSGTTDYLHGTSESDEPEPEHILQLRSKLEAYDGEDLRERYNRAGFEGMLKELDIELDPKS